MKNSLIKFVEILAVSTLLWGCKHDPEPVVVPEPEWTLDLVENDPVPEWKALESGIYQFSMTAVVRLSPFLEKYADSADRVSAFIGNECRAVATTEEVEGNRLFFLYIKGNTSEVEMVTLQYYSVLNKKMYTCNNLLPFTQNGVYGTAGNPEIPPFEESGKYPCVMNAVVALPDALPFEKRSADRLAVFVENECRGVAEPVDVGGRTVYQFEIRGKKDETATVYFQYYSMQTSGIYKATESFAFQDEGAKGSLDDPFMISLQPVVE